MVALYLGTSPDYHFLGDFVLVRCYNVLRDFSEWPEYRGAWPWPDIIISLGSEFTSTV